MIPIYLSPLTLIYHFMFGKLLKPLRNVDMEIFNVDRVIFYVIQVVFLERMKFDEFQTIFLA